MNCKNCLKYILNQYSQNISFRIFLLSLNTCFILPIHCYWMAFFLSKHFFYPFESNADTFEQASHPFSMYVNVNVTHPTYKDWYKTQYNNEKLQAKCSFYPFFTTLPPMGWKAGSSICGFFVTTFHQGPSEFFGWFQKCSAIFWDTECLVHIQAQKNMATAVASEGTSFRTSVPLFRTQEV